jgi:UDP-N-acetylglucosamine 4,6-dehydratase
MRILVTGGTGSLGRALTRHLLATTDWHVIVLSRDEWKQSQMRADITDPRLDFFLGDVRDQDRLRLAFSSVDTVVHTAALKRVDSVARDPDEVFKTNVMGTRNVLRAAHRAGVRRVLLISSDKACYATNAYGVSKAQAEWMTTAYNVYGAPSGTYSSVLRYGNVLGSRGSVVHLWRTQPLPLTITNPRATRFIVTMPQAVNLVTSALRVMEGGEIFVPMLPAADALTLAEAVRPGMSYVESGWRPGGEKYHETLLTAEEAERAVDLSTVSIIPPFFRPWRAGRPWWAALPPAHQEARTSETARRLSIEQVREMLTTIPTEGV